MSLDQTQSATTASTISSSDSNKLAEELITDQRLESFAQYLYRWAPPIGIYGGTIDVFRNMIAQHVLGLGRPNYSPPKQAR